MKIKKEILTAMDKTLPRYLVLQVSAKLTKRIRGHVRALQAISCISYVLLCDWPSHLGEQINGTFQFRNCHGKFFCSFWCIHGNNPRAVRSGESGYTQKRLYPWAKRYLPMGKRASVTMTFMVSSQSTWLVVWWWWLLVEWWWWLVNGCWRGGMIVGWVAVMVCDLVVIVVILACVVVVLPVSLSLKIISCLYDSIFWSCSPHRQMDV